MTEFELFLAVAPIVFAIRALFILPAGRFGIPDSWRSALDHARPAVLAALLTTVLVGSGPLAAPDLRAVAIAAVAVAVSSRASMGTTVLVGVGVIVAMGVVGW